MNQANDSSSDHWAAISIGDATAVKNSVSALTDTHDLLVQNCSKIQALSDEVSESMEPNALHEPPWIMKPLDRGAWIKLCLADRFREMRHIESVQPKWQEFKLRMLAVLRGDTESTRLSRAFSMYILSRTVVNPDFRIIPDLGAQEVDELAREYLSDADHLVGRAAAFPLVQFMHQGGVRGREIEQLFQAELTASAANSDWQAFLKRELEGLRTDYSDWCISETDYRTFRAADDATLLQTVRTSELNRATYALEMLTDNWDRTSVNFKSLLDSVEESRVGKRILTRVCPAIPETASDLEKQNVDSLLGYIEARLGKTEHDEHLVRSLLGLLNRQGYRVTCDNLRNGEIYNQEPYAAEKVRALLSAYLSRTNNNAFSVALIIRATVDPANSEESKILLSRFAERIEALNRDIQERPDVYAREHSLKTAVREASIGLEQIELQKQIDELDANIRETSGGKSLPRGDPRLAEREALIEKLETVRTRHQRE